jgi:small neutral amino acid transporter SnatA (MarC family)
MVCIGLLINLVLMLLAMWNAHRILAILGKNTLAVVNKIVMILIAAIAVSLIRRGIVSIVQGMASQNVK